MSEDRILIGYHAIEEALKGVQGGGMLYVSQKNERIAGLIKVASSVKIKIKRSTDEHLLKIGGSDHRGAVLVLDAPVKTIGAGVSDFLNNLTVPRSLVLILDGITDPHNLGAVLRSADQFGVDMVILPTKRSVKVNNTVLKTSAGAGMYVPVREVTNLVRCIEELKEHGFWIYGAQISGDPLWQCELADRAALVLGAEGKGIGRLIGEKCDQFVHIPTMGHIDSLNVSVAGGIMLYEYRRQKTIG